MFICLFNYSYYSFSRVYLHFVSIAQDLSRDLSADDARDLQFAGDDRGMAGNAAFISDYRPSPFH